MSSWSTLVAALGAVAVIWVGFVVALLVGGRRSDAVALVRFVPDCIVLVRRLVADPGVPRRHKLALIALIGYLALPFDLVPDFIPIAGQLDDVLLVALVLRRVLRGAGASPLEEHWSGPPRSLDVLLRAAGLPRAAADQEDAGRSAESIRL